jgi:protein-disulfide isomerase
MLKWLCTMVLLGLPLLGAFQSASAAEPLSAERRQQLERVIRDYLLKHPELIAEALQKLDAKRQAQEKSESQALISSLHSEIFDSRYDYVANPDGRVPLVEFFDYQCGYCKRMQPSIEKVRADEADVRIIYKEFPILGPASVFAARAAIAARRQGDKYLAFHNAMMALKGGLDEDRVLATAGEAGLDVARLKLDMEDPIVEQTIEFNHGLAQQMNIRGTPTLIVGQTMLPGALPHEQLVKVLQETRENCTVC